MKSPASSDSLMPYWEHSSLLFHCCSVFSFCCHHNTIPSYIFYDEVYKRLVSVIVVVLVPQSANYQGEDAVVLLLRSEGLHRDRCCWRQLARNTCQYCQSTAVKCELPWSDCCVVVNVFLCYYLHGLVAEVVTSLYCLRIEIKEYGATLLLCLYFRIYSGFAV